MGGQVRKWNKLTELIWTVSETSPKRCAVRCCQCDFVNTKWRTIVHRAEDRSGLGARKKHSNAWISNHQWNKYIIYPNVYIANMSSMSDWVRLARKIWKRTIQFQHISTNFRITWQACHFQTWKCCREFWTTAERALMDQHSTLNVLEMPSFTLWTSAETNWNKPGGAFKI